MSRGLFGIGLFLACLLGSAPLSAASFFLTEQETKAAIEVGQQSLHLHDFDREWQVNNADGSSLTALTPFYRLVFAARNRAFKNETLKRREIEELVKDKGKLLFSVRLYGPRADFARWYQPVLLVPGREAVQPSFVQNERTALREEDGRYLARCFYSFPTAGLNPRGQVTLLVRDPDGRGVARFTVDLASMR